MTTIRRTYFDALYAELGENPLPCFRAKDHDLTIATTDAVPQEYTHHMGLDCGKRVLPYSVQDRYSRDLRPKKLPSIVIENDYISATFLPTLGGRLISLYDKEKKTELLYDNKAIQFANLASRDAWFAGGIEWNIGQYGHTYMTADDVCFTEHEDGDDRFLRMVIYERAKKVYFQIDFHLPSDSRMLYAYMKVQNLYSETTSLYYWTNTAVPETKETRVFASSSEAVYLNQKPVLAEREFGYTKIPYHPIFTDIDASYSQNFNRVSTEYFFTCNHDAMPWEVSIQKGGTGFFEASTPILGYRKMFCWGTGPGGKHWQDFLAPGQDTSYLEVQSGMAPTQLHGLEFEGGASREWVQAFGSLTVDEALAQDKNYELAHRTVREAAESKISIESLQQKLEEYRTKAEMPGTLIHDAANWAPVEAELYGIDIPAQFRVATAPQPWADFLKTGVLPTDRPFTLPCVTGQKWIDRLSIAAEGETEEQKAMRCYYLAIALEEEEKLSKATDLFLYVAEVYKLPIVYRNIAKIMEKMDDLKAAVRYYRKAENLGLDIFMQEEFFQLLIKAERYDEALEFYNGLDNITDNILIDRARLAIFLKDPKWFDETGFLKKELTTIREGNTVMSDIWEDYHKVQGLEVPPVPTNLNFRQVEF